MSKTLVIGSTGQIGLQLLPLLQQTGLKVVALTRNPGKLAGIAGLEIIEGDLESDFEHAFVGCERVIFTAGSGASTGADKTLLVDLWAARKAVDYALKHHLKHAGGDDPLSADAHPARRGGVRLAESCFSGVLISLQAQHSGVFSGRLSVRT